MQLHWSYISFVLTNWQVISRKHAITGLMLSSLVLFWHSSGSLKHVCWDIHNLYILYWEWLAQMYLYNANCILQILFCWICLLMNISNFHVFISISLLLGILEMITSIPKSNHVSDKIITIVLKTNWGSRWPGALSSNHCLLLTEWLSPGLCMNYLG